MKDNFDLRKYLAEGRLLKENTGKTISYIQDGDNKILFLPPGEYPLIVSGFYGGGSYRSFRKQPVSTLTVKDNGLELPIIRGNLVYKNTPPVTHPNQLPDGYSPYVDAFREKVKKRRISDETGLHVDLRDFDFNEVDNFDNLAEGRLLKEDDAPRVTNWYKLNWDFSDDESVNFGYFDVDLDQFKQASKNGYVIDDSGRKRIIDEPTAKAILDDYEDNWPED